MWSVMNCSRYNLVNTGGLSATIMWIIRLGHFNILLCETSTHNVKEYVIHPKDSFKHRPAGQQRLVLLKRQKRKPQAYSNHSSGGYAWVRELCGENSAPFAHKNMAGAYLWIQERAVARNVIWGWLKEEAAGGGWVGVLQLGVVIFRRQFYLLTQL